jgi:hypothetical protein
MVSRKKLDSLEIFLPAHIRKQVFSPNPAIIEKRKGESYVI